MGIDGQGERQVAQRAGAIAHPGENHPGMIVEQGIVSAKSHSLIGRACRLLETSVFVQSPSKGIVSVYVFADGEFGLSKTVRFVYFVIVVSIVDHQLAVVDDLVDGV